MRTRTLSPLRTALAVAAAAALLALGACASSGSTGAGGIVVVGAPSATPAPGGGTGSSGATATQATSAPATKTTTKKPSGPRIVEFTWAQKPTCPVVGTTDAPFSTPGIQGILEWKTSGGVTSVALSLDSPDFFKQYPGQGSLGVYPANDTFPVNFECDPAQGQTTTHTYTLDTIGGGKSVEKTITYSTPTSP